MTVEETSRHLWAACVKAGVNPEVVFAHYDDRDLEAYREALEAGHIPLGELPTWMFSTARTIAEGRCLCRTCKVR